MARYVVLKEDDHTVQNYVEWDGLTQWTPPKGYIALPIPDDLPVRIAGTYDPDTGFITDPPEPEPTPVVLSDMDQLVKVLLDKGVIRQEDLPPDLATAADAAVDPIVP